MIPTTLPRLVTMMVSPLLVRSNTSEALRVTSRTPIVVVVISRCYNLSLEPASLGPAESGRPVTAKDPSHRRTHQGSHRGTATDAEVGRCSDPSLLSACTARRGIWTPRSLRTFRLPATRAPVAALAGFWAHL